MGPVVTTAGGGGTGSSSILHDAGAPDAAAPRDLAQPGDLDALEEVDAKAAGPAVRERGRRVVHLEDVVVGKVQLRRIDGLAAAAVVGPVPERCQVLVQELGDQRLEGRGRRLA